VPIPPYATIVGGAPLTTSNQYIGNYLQDKSIDFTNVFAAQSSTYYAFQYAVPTNPCGADSSICVVQVVRQCYVDGEVTYCNNDPSVVNVETLLREGGFCTTTITDGTFVDVSGFGAGFNTTTGDLDVSAAPAPGTYYFDYTPLEDSSFLPPGFNYENCEDCTRRLTVNIEASATAGTSSKTYASPLVYDKLAGPTPVFPANYITGADTSASLNPQ